MKLEILYTVERPMERRFLPDAVRAPIWVAVTLASGRTYFTHAEARVMFDEMKEYTPQLRLVRIERCIETWHGCTNEEAHSN